MSLQQSLCLVVTLTSYTLALYTLYIKGMCESLQWCFGNQTLTSAPDFACFLTNVTKGVASKFYLVLSDLYLANSVAINCTRGHTTETSAYMLVWIQKGSCEGRGLPCGCITFWRAKLFSFVLQSDC